MQHENEQLIECFYRAFQRLDWQAMSDCYHEDIWFSDPVFTDLRSDQVANMWHMLCDKAEEFDLQYSHISADDHYGSARWIASYRFSQTGRRVRNVIFAEFQFKEGKIIRHSDHFSFWKWAISALGLPGVLFGWSGRFKRKVQQKALAGLRAYSKKARKAFS